MLFLWFEYIVCMYASITHKVSLHIWSSDCWWYPYFIASASCCCLDIPTTPRDGCPFVVSYCNFEVTNIDWESNHQKDLWEQNSCSKILIDDFLIFLWAAMHTRTSRTAETVIEPHRSMYALSKVLAAKSYPGCDNEHEPCRGSDDWFRVYGTVILEGKKMWMNGLIVIMISSIC